MDSLGDDERDGCGSGRCTFREALLTEAPRFVNFNVSGTIRLRSRLELSSKHSCLTVSGRRSPAGVTITNYPLSIRRGFHEGIFRYLRIRPAGPHIQDDVGVRGGCNTAQRFCESARSKLNARTGGPDTATGACTTDADCAGPAHTGRCLWYQAAEFRAGSSDIRHCTPCNRWRRSSPHDWSGCNDRVVANGILGDSVDAVQIQPDVRNVVFDHNSLTWACDEALDIRLGEGASTLSLTHNIIGSGLRSDAARPCHREQAHNYGILVHGGRKGPAQGFVSLLGNYLVHNRKRSPKITAGSGEFSNNIVYNTATAFLQVLPRGVPLEWDIRRNLFRVGPDFSPRQRQGRCTGPHPDAGEPCRRPADCQGDCGGFRPFFFTIHPGRGRPRLFLEGNLFEDGEQPAAAPPLLDGQWDRVKANAARPPRPRDAAGAWGGRRSESLPRSSGHLVSVGELPSHLLPHVGASLPGRDAIDEALVEAFRTRKGHVPVPSPLPSHQGMPWEDDDQDGLDDRWEERHDLSDQGPLDDPDGDGYPNVEEWMNGTDPRARQAP